MFHLGRLSCRSFEALRTTDQVREEHEDSRGVVAVVMGSPSETSSQAMTEQLAGLVREREETPQIPLAWYSLIPQKRKI